MMGSSSYYSSSLQERGLQPSSFSITGTSATTVSIPNSSSSNSLSSSATSSPLLPSRQTDRRAAARGRPFLKRRLSWTIESCDVRWAQYMVEIAAFDRIPLKNTTMNLLVRNGIPNNLRTKVWPIISGSKFLMQKHKGYYQSLLRRHQESPSPFLRQIETDLHRTFPELIDFSAQYASNPLSINKLRSVLVAYSIRNERVGYCQGMNFLAGFLLRMFEEEEAFWLLVALIDEILPAHYYEGDLRGIRAETELFTLIVAKEFPEMYRHLEQHNIDIGMFTLDWFVSLFVFSYKPSMVARIWDLIMYEGRVSLFCVSLGILREVEKNILKHDRMDRLYEYLKNLNRVKLNLDKIIKNANIQVMSDLVKRLSFSIVQTPAYSDAISAIPPTKKPNTYSWRSTRPKVTESPEEKKAPDSRKNSEDSSFLGLFSQMFSKKNVQSGTISRSSSVDRNKYFG